jgi:membrane protease YdiL (CAAX protease family)
MGRIGRAIVGHPGLQALGFVAALNLYIWWVEPAASEAGRALGLLLLTALPICSNLLHRDRARDLGIRLDNLYGSGREVATATVICSLVILAGSAGFGWHSRLSPKAALIIAGYLAWGLTQQYALQAFVHRRLRESLGHPRVASAVAALLFGVVHLPNPVLVVTTIVAGYIWCRLYDRSPNLFTLAASHAWLATMLMTHVPRDIHHVMRLGPGYWAVP